MRVGATGSGESLQQSRSSPLSLFVRSNIGAIRYSKIRVVRDEHVHGQARLVVHSTSYKYGVCYIDTDHRTWVQHVYCIQFVVS